MKVKTSITLIALALIVGTTGLEFGASLPAPFAFVTGAEARVGRPATPVSVAGVARRTTRRCVADVYDC